MPAKMALSRPEWCKVDVQSMSNALRIETTIRLTISEKSTLKAAFRKQTDGATLNKREQRALDKYHRLKRQEAFLEDAAKLPFVLFSKIVGLSRAKLKRLEKRLTVNITSKTVDLFTVLPLVFSQFDTSQGETPGQKKLEAKRQAETYSELARLLGMTCKDPVRTLKEYHRRGMPGRPGGRGKANGRWDVEECRLWIANQTRDAAGEDPEQAETIKEKRRRLVELDLEIKEREKLEQLGRLTDVEEIAAFNVICINNARAILEALPDQVAAELPADLPDEVRAGINRRIEGLLDSSFYEIERILEGDTDPTDDLDDDPIDDHASD